MNNFLAATGNGLAHAHRTQSGSWSIETRLPGHAVTCLAVDPHNTRTLYAGTRAHGLLRSTDGGRSWAPIGLEGQEIKAVSASRLDPAVLYAGTKPALVFRSADGGRSWEELPSFRRIPSRRFWFSPAEAPFKAYVQGIALSPVDPDLILVGIEAGAVVRSTDGGETWQDHRKGALRDCHSITFHSTEGDWVYEGGGTGAGFAVSRDGGSTWLQPREGLDRHYGWACAADPADPEVWYCSLSPSPAKAHGGVDAQAFIYRSVRGGAWQKLGGGLPQPLSHMPYALLTDPDQPGSLYAGLSNGDVWHSADQGDTWQQLPFNLGSIQRSLVMFAG